MKALGSQGLRYLSVGATCAIVHNAVMIGGDLIGWHYVLSATVSYVIVVMLGYVLHTRFTFRARGSAAGFVKYAIPMAGNFPASIALMFVLCDLIGLAVPIAAPVATVLLFVANFAAARWAILGGKAGPSAQD